MSEAFAKDSLTFNSFSGLQIFHQIKSWNLLWMFATRSCQQGGEDVDTGHQFLTISWL